MSLAATALVIGIWLIGMTVVVACCRAAAAGDRAQRRRAGPGRFVNEP